MVKQALHLPVVKVLRAPGPICTDTVMHSVANQDVVQHALLYKNLHYKIMEQNITSYSSSCNTIGFLGKHDNPLVCDILFIIKLKIFFEVTLDNYGIPVALLPFLEVHSTSMAQDSFC